MIEYVLAGRRPNGRLFGTHETNFGKNGKLDQIILLTGSLRNKLTYLPNLPNTCIVMPKRKLLKLFLKLPNETF